MKKYRSNPFTDALKAQIIETARDCADAVALIDWITLVENPRIEQAYEQAVGSAQNDFLSARASTSRNLGTFQAAVTGSGFCSSTAQASAAMLLPASQRPAYINGDDDQAMALYAEIAYRLDSRIVWHSSRYSASTLRLSRQALEQCDCEMLEGILGIVNGKFGDVLGQNLNDLTGFQLRDELKRVKALRADLQEDLDDICSYTPYAYRHCVSDPEWIEQRIFAFGQARQMEEQLSERWNHLRQRAVSMRASRTPQVNGVA